MAASWTWYNLARLYAVDGTGLLLPTNAYKAGLTSSSYTPNAETHSLYADITNELATANGYTVGGVALASVVLTRSTVTVKLDADDSVWTAAGGAITARYAFVYVNATLNGHVKPLLGYILLNTAPADVSAPDGNTLTLRWNSAGIANLT